MPNEKLTDEQLLALWNETAANFLRHPSRATKAGMMHAFTRFYIAFLNGSHDGLEDELARLDRHAEGVLAHAEPVA